MAARNRTLAVLVVLATLGAVYGWVSALQNRNPYYEPGAPPAPLGAAWGWRPSPAWLPSYLLCVVPTNGYGIHHTRSGYLFRDDGGRRRYLAASVAIGGTMGLLAGAGALVARREYARLGRGAGASPTPGRAAGKGR